MDVLCRNGCGGPFHETTEKFNPEASPHGGMFRLKEPYRGNGWSSFPEHEGVTGDAIECPNCGAPYADITGRVKVEGGYGTIKVYSGQRPEPPEDEPSGTLMVEKPLTKEEAESITTIRVPSAEEQSCSVVIDTKSPEAIDMQIRAMTLAGKKPGEIGKELGIHHLTVAKRIKAIGEA